MSLSDRGVHGGGLRRRRTLGKWSAGRDRICAVEMLAGACACCGMGPGAVKG